MFSVLLLTTYFACYLWYQSSKSSNLYSNDKAELWLRSNSKYIKIFSFLVLVGSIFFAVFNFGLTSGILISFVLLMVLFSLFVVIYPLKIITYKSLILVFIITITVEFLF